MALSRAAPSSASPLRTARARGAGGAGGALGRLRRHHDLATPAMVVVSVLAERGRKCSSPSHPPPDALTPPGRLAPPAPSRSGLTLIPAPADTATTRRAMRSEWRGDWLEARGGEWPCWAMSILAALGDTTSLAADIDKANNNSDRKTIWSRWPPRRQAWPRQPRRRSVALTGPAVCFAGHPHPRPPRIPPSVPVLFSVALFRCSAGSRGSRGPRGAPTSN